jgi:acetyltransferase-like isoleucine patch superfamily enzyme
MREREGRGRAGALWRVGWTFVAMLVVETLVCGLAVLPVLAGLVQLGAWIEPTRGVGPLVFSVLIIPSYVGFALCLMVVSAVATRVTGARTPPNAEMRIADMGWPLMRWVRYMVASHIVRVLAGPLFRGSPIWSAYLRLNGARLGRHVYVNTLFISDHNLLEVGDDVVIGSEVHVSGHTVEAGIVKTASVRLGHRSTIGLGTVVEIDVVVGTDCQVGALSFVPKHTTLDDGAVYAGIPVRRVR